MKDFELTRLATNINYYGTFGSFQQKIAENANGIFLTYVVYNLDEYTAGNTWRLLRSTDGGATFSLLYEAVHGTRAPVVETDANNNIYLALPDWTENDGRFYFMRFLASENYATPHTTTITGATCWAKYAMYYDEPRGRFYVGTQVGDLFTVGINGVQIGGVLDVWNDGPNGGPQYPLLEMDDSGVLYYAQTNWGGNKYRNILAVKSADGGATWARLDGTPVSLPIACDETGAATMISGMDEMDVNTWLSSMLYKGGRLHFFYAVNHGATISKVPYVNYDTATGQRHNYRDLHQAGDLVNVLMYDGSFTTHDTTAGSLLYAIIREDQGRAAAIYSPNNGANWYDYALDTAARWQYTTATARYVNSNGDIMGTFMAQTPGGSGDFEHDAWFFRIDTTTPPADTDGDDMVDDWENEYHLNPNSPADRDIDSDQDGASNYAEYVAGTDPTVTPQPPMIEEHITFDNAVVDNNSCMFKSSTANEMNWRADPAPGSTLITEGGKLKFGCPTNSASNYTGMVYRAYLDDNSNALFQPGTTVEFTVKDINAVYTSPTRATLQVDFAADTAGVLTSIGTYGVFIEGNGYLYDVPGFEGGDVYNQLSPIGTYTDIRYKFEFTDTNCTISMDAGSGYGVRGTYNYIGNANISGTDGIEMQLFPHSWSGGAYHPYDFYIDDLIISAPDCTYLPACVCSSDIEEYTYTESFDNVALGDCVWSLAPNGSYTGGTTNAGAWVSEVGRIHFIKNMASPSLWSSPGISNDPAGFAWTSALPIQLVPTSFTIHITGDMSHWAGLRLVPGTQVFEQGGGALDWPLFQFTSTTVQGHYFSGVNIEANLSAASSLDLTWRYEPGQIVQQIVVDGGPALTHAYPDNDLVAGDTLWFYFWVDNQVGEGAPATADLVIDGLSITADPAATTSNGFGQVTVFPTCATGISSLPPPTIVTNGGLDFSVGITPITIQGTTDPATQAMQVNGTPFAYTAGSNTWATPVNLAATPTTFHFTAVDAIAAVTTPATITLTLDTSADFDEDGLLDASEGDADLDNDGMANYADPDSDADGIADGTESELGSNPYDVLNPDIICSTTVIWYVDNAGQAVGLPPRDGKTTTLVYLHNNRAVTRRCMVEYYSQDGVYIGPFVDRTFDIAPDASVAFRPVADDPASVLGGQEAPPGRAVPNRPLGTANGNDGKGNGSLVIRWIGEPDDVQGEVSSFATVLGAGPHASSYALPPGIAQQSGAAAVTANSICVPWYVDNAGTAVRVPPVDGKTTSLVYLHNNRDELLACTIEYYTQDGVFVGPASPQNQFTIAANTSIAFRPVADDPATVLGGQEAIQGRAVPNRPLGTGNGNDNKRNGSIVIRWNGAPTDVQGFCASYGNTAGSAQVTPENPLGLSPHTLAYLLPLGLTEAALQGASQPNMLTVPWYVDSAGAAQAIPPRDHKATSIVYLHNNWNQSLQCTIEYYTQDGVLVGPAAPNHSFVIPANASIAFRPALDDPASVPGGQEAAAGLAVPNRPVNLMGGNDGKQNGSIIVRWTGRPGFVQGVCTTFHNAPALGPSSLGYLLPESIVTPLVANGNQSLSVPWYVDNAEPASRIPPRDGRVASLVYLHNNESVDIACTIEYYTQDGVFVGPPPGANDFVVPAASSLAFRPVADDPASLPGGQEAPSGQAVPNRPLGTDGGNDNKKNGAIVIRWTGSQYGLQGICATHGSPPDMQPATTDNPHGLAAYAFGYPLPSAGDGGKKAGTP